MARYRGVRSLTADERRTRFELELLEARGGLHPYISTSAAAWYLKMHPSTLSKLVSKGGAPPSVVRDATRADNAKKFYQLDDLDHWLKLRNARTGTERRSLVQLDMLAEEERKLRAQKHLLESHASIRRLKKRLSSE
jgi:hypothetical protein